MRHATHGHLNKIGSARPIILVVAVFACTAAAFLILAFILAPDVTVHGVRTDLECINNLRQIDGAKEQWIMDTHQTNGAPANPAAINSYLKYGERKCPEGGVYTYGNVGEDPHCTVKGHKLPITAQ